MRLQMAYCIRIRMTGAGGGSGDGGGDGGGEMHELVVPRVVCEPSHIRIEGLDPSVCPGSIQKHLQISSYKLTALLYPDEVPFEVESIRPTERTVPLSSPSF